MKTSKTKLCYSVISICIFSLLLVLEIPFAFFVLGIMKKTPNIYLYPFYLYFIRHSIEELYDNYL